MNVERRTNIVLDENLVGQCLQITGLKTKRAVIEYALHELVRLHQQSKILKLKGKITWEGNLTEMRRNRR